MVPIGHTFTSLEYRCGWEWEPQRFWKGHAMLKEFKEFAAKGKKAEEEAPAAPPEPSAEENLVTEIRDLLKMSA